MRTRILFAICINLILGNSLLSQWSKVECKKYFEDWKLWSLRHTQCMEDLDFCSSADARRAYQAMSAGHNGFTSSGCLQMLSSLSNKELKAFLACPADALLMNSEGKKIGWYNGALINEIPGATYKVDSESEYYQVPLYDAYRIEITGTGQGTATLSFIADEIGTSFDTKYFESIPLEEGIKYSGEIQVQGEIESLSSPSSKFIAKSKTTTVNDPIWTRIQAIGKTKNTSQSIAPNNNTESSSIVSNTPPTASFSMMPEYPDEESRIVVVSTSTDPDNDNLSFKWYVDDFNQGTQPKVEVDPLPAGYHVIRLEVTDGTGASDMVERTILIEPASNMNEGQEVVVDNTNWGQDSYSWSDESSSDIVELLPYLGGGIVLLLVLGALFRRNKGDSSIATNVEDLIPENEKQTAPVKTDDGFVEVHFCTQCGTAVLPGAKFCVQCGAPLVDSV